MLRRETVPQDVFVGDVLSGLNQPKNVTLATVVTIVVNIVSNVVLIWEFGILGAALGTVVVVTIGATLRTYYLTQFMKI